MHHNIVRSLPASLTLTLAGRVQELVGEGRKIYKFNIGEPDFPTPENIKEEGVRAIHENMTRYTAGAGIPDLRDAIMSDLEERLGIPGARENIVVTIGGKFALAASIMAMIAQGDDVLIPTPCFLSYPDMVNLAGGTPVKVPLTEADGFLPRPEVLDKYLTPRTRLVILNSPHNPTGVVYPEGLISDLVEWVNRKDLYILSDEVYDRLIFDGLKHYSLAAYDSIRERVLLVNSFSKTYCMTGWRVGYLMAPEPIARAVTNIQSHMASSTNAIAQIAGIEALRGPQVEVETMLASFQRRRDLMSSLVREIPDVSFTYPEGTFYLFLNVSSYFSARNPGSMELAMTLLEESGVASVPGFVFGDDNFIRLSFATSDEDIKDGITALKYGLEALKQSS